MDLLRRNYQGTYAQDLDFGPEYGDFFDFSLWFESVIMTICPVVVFLAIAPFHILHYRKRPVTAKITIHFWLLTVGYLFKCAGRKEIWLTRMSRLLL